MEEKFNIQGFDSEKYRQEAGELARQHAKEEACTKKGLKEGRITMKELEIHHFIVLILRKIREKISDQVQIFSQEAAASMDRQNKNALKIVAEVYNLQMEEVLTLQKKFEPMLSAD